ncbi:MAG TPA: chemotaxis response regulator protein-glutamate methylesterase [Anaerolineaceae bacterium]|nr:chemotaxis response regulator protein-glutamate methylesterase [Anaerolineaceae bacterium]HPN52546.1 chemotaxis response regulator protein-glutamate methylesterase [Anaerolineaceae bacterium]
MALPDGTKPVRVLVVDDSAFMRYTITNHLNQVAGLTVVGAARDGQDALEQIPKLQPDVVTLDVEMPRMDGLATLREIMVRFPRPVIMLSSQTKEGATETIQALTLGAVDFAAKPDYKASMASVLDEVANKIIRAAGAKVTPLMSAAAMASQTIQMTMAAPAAQGEKRTRPLLRSDKILIIGSSTGGPRALNAVVPNIPASLPAAVLIVQHMPANFTRSLAERLNNQSSLLVKEAEAGDVMEVGKALLAPGGFHMTLDAQGKVALNQNPPVHGVRPSVDVTMLSVVPHFGSRVVGVVLTGMGSDGTNGASLIHASGGKVIAEAEETCVVWGMPRAVAEAGAADLIVPLGDVAGAVKKLIEG